MRRFLYYIPGRSGVNPRILAEHGLLDRFTRGVGAGSGLLEHGITAINAGPAGSGVIVSPGPQPPPGPEQLGQLAWQENHSAFSTQHSAFWLAIEDPVSPPGPDDLLRPVGIRGYAWKLADGNQWTLPVIWRWDDSKQQHTPNVPKSLAFGGVGGKVQNRVRAEYAGVDALAGKLFDGFAREKQLPADEAFAAAAQLLSVNYRIGIEEAGMLGIFDEQALLDVLGAAIDYPAISAQADREARNGIVNQEPEVS